MRGPIRFRRFVAFVLFAVMTAALGWNTGGAANADEPASSDTADAAAKFDRQIAPLLAKHCFSCHSGAEPEAELNLSESHKALAGGESGKAIVPGQPEESLLWKRIASGEMPPENPLLAEEKALLRAWIASGAKWGTDPIDPFRYTTDSRAGYDWWALQPVDRPEPPAVKEESWVRNPIDRFILARLAKEELEPSEEAGRRVLLRRLCFDLLGLPPSPEQVEEFITDRSPEAYSSLVDRLLASPHYGERWARHWLDIIRFGESQGFERDKLRTNSWRYRDWVVNAFNGDMPYDEFARRQLAGDVLQPEDPQAVIATGFLVAGAYDEVGQDQQSAAMKAVVRQDEMEDIVAGVGQTFLGLTVNCARCHDHKFDPVTQTEYYRLVAALAGVRHGERKVSGPTLHRRAADEAASLQARIDDLNCALSAIEGPARSQILAERKTKPAPEVKVPRAVAEWDFRHGLKDRVGSHDIKLHGGAELREGALNLDGQKAYASSAPIERQLTEKTLEAWVRLESLQQGGGSVISLQSLDGRVFDAIVYGERQEQRWMAGSNGFVRTQSFEGPAENAADRQYVHVAITYQADGTITGYRDGRAYGKPYKAGGPVTFAAGEARLVLGLRHPPPGGNRMLAGSIRRARLYDRALSPEQIAASAGAITDFVSEKELLARLTEDQKTRRDQLRFELAQLAELKKRAEENFVYAVAPQQPEETHFLHRGNPAQKGEVVAAGAIACLQGIDAEFGLPPDAPEAERRRRLAEWITDPQNPLFARVIVNRLWHYHFGVGLVNTPSDFGFNGGRPSHPELIDWLAAELIASNWSLKELHKTIVMSATYRQSSRGNPQGMKIDANNRLLWRKSPLRLEAEAVRDAMLAVAGELNRDLGGPGYYDFTTYVHNTQFYTPLDPVGRTFNRRSLYRTWVRSGRNRFLDVFDCPDPSTKTPRRAVTTTPLQALSLMNNSLVLRMADRFAARLQRECGENAEKQITRAYHLAYGREPAAEKLNVTRKFIEKHGLPAFCRVVFNSNEFLYVD